MIFFQESPFFSLKEGFTFINDVVLEDRVRGSLPPEKKEDCQVWLHSKVMSDFYDMK